MDWLGGWLKSIILVILLATFVDILLPNQTMQRYVKTVMSLFILLTLLHPLFSLFQKNNSIDSMLADAIDLGGSIKSSGTLSAFSPQPEGPADMPALGNIERNAKQLQSQQEQQSQRLVQQQISDLMKKSIEQTTGMRVVNLKVETAKDSKGHLQIRQVNVQAAEPLKSAAARSESSGPVKPLNVESVEPVDIAIEPRAEPVFGSGVEKSNNAVESSRVQGTGNKAGAVNTQAQSRIKMLLSKDWEVPLEQIVVEVMTSDGKARH